LKLIQAQGLKSAFVDASGNIALGDPPPNEKGWVVGVSASEALDHDAPTLVLRNCGVATSSDQHQFMEVGGKRYSHIIDPRTGWALTNKLTVTVVAPSAMAADVWGTAFAVQGVQWSEKVSAEKGLECIFR
jgi:thiamine biosynthesis lipoprotein